MDYLASPATYVFTCSDGYQYPTDSPYATDKKQTIKCETNGSLIDPATGKSNPDVFPCKKVINERKASETID